MRDEEGLGAFFLIFGLTLASLAFTILLHIRARTIGRYAQILAAAAFAVISVTIHLAA
jgi:hypothetical protein